MRRVCYHVAMSLDGYIAGPNGEIDWIVTDPDIDFTEMFERYDTLLMGRRTWEAATAMGGGPSVPGVTTVVVSRSLTPADHPGVTIVSDVETTVRGLREDSGKDIWLFGGGSLFRSLLAAGLVDRVGAAIVPVVLGGGVRFLPEPATRARLTLAAHRVYQKSGIVSLDYDIAAAPRKTRTARRRKEK